MHAHDLDSIPLPRRNVRMIQLLRNPFVRSSQLIVSVTCWDFRVMTRHLTMMKTFMTMMQPAGATNAQMNVFS